MFKPQSQENLHLSLLALSRIVSTRRGQGSGLEWDGRNVVTFAGSRSFDEATVNGAESRFAWPRRTGISRESNLLSIGDI